MVPRSTRSVDEDRHQLALECHNIAQEILAFIAQRPDAPLADEAPRGARHRVVADATEFEDEFAIQFSDRLQHLIIGLTAAGYGTDALDPLTYGGTSRLGARSAAETLHAISNELPREGGA